MKLLLRQKQAVSSFDEPGFHDRECIHTSLWESGAYKIKLVYDITHRGLIYRARAYAWNAGNLGWIEVWAEAWHDIEEHNKHRDNTASAPNLEPDQELIDRIEKRVLERVIMVID